MSRRSHRHGERAHARVHRPESARPAGALGPAASAEVPAPSIPPVVSAALPPVVSAALPPMSVVPAGIALPSEPVATGQAPVAPRIAEPAAVALSAPYPPGLPNGHALEPPGVAAIGAPNGHVQGMAESAPALVESAGSGARPSSWPAAAGADRAAGVDRAAPDRPEAASSDSARNGALGGCTAPQLRRFIKSRAYLPLHELRRRFAIEGADDDVAAIELDGTRVYVGLPEREGRLLGELLRGGDVGFELSHDPTTPIIVGVYPMRPVPRS